MSQRVEKDLERVVLAVLLKVRDISSTTLIELLRGQMSTKVRQSSANEVSEQDNYEQDDRCAGFQTS